MRVCEVLFLISIIFCGCSLDSAIDSAGGIGILLLAFVVAVLSLIAIGGDTE